MLPLSTYNILPFPSGHPVTAYVFFLTFLWLLPSLGLGDTLRQAWELISGPCLGVKARFLSFNRIQSRVVTGLLTGHNTLRRHLHLMVLSDSPLCRRCGVEEETSAHILCECEALASLGHVYLGSFFLDPQDIKSISLGAIWNFSKATGSHKLIWGTKGPLIKAYMYRDCKVSNPIEINQSFNLPSLQSFLQLTHFRGQFLPKKWSFKLVFLLFIVCSIFLSSLAVHNTYFSHDGSKWYSPSFSSTAFQNFPGISDLLSEVSAFQYRAKLCSKCSTLLDSSLNLSPVCLWKESSCYCWMLLLPWQSWI